MITLQTYADDVERMRNAQRDYFRSRTPAHLERAKSLQAKVDKMTREILSGYTLFPDHASTNGEHDEAQSRNER